MTSKTAGLAAIGFAVVIVSLNAVLIPAGGAFSTRHDLVRLTAALAPLAWILATVFGAGVTSLVGMTGWSLVGFAGIILQNLCFTGVMAARLAFTVTPSEGLRALHDALFIFNGTFLAMALTGLSLAGLRAGVIRRRHAGLGLTAAALQFTSAVLGPLVIEDPGLIGLLGLSGWLIWVIWLMAYGVVLLRSGNS